MTEKQRKRNRGILIRGGTIVTMNRSRDILYNKDILIVGSRIEAIDDLSYIDNRRVDQIIKSIATKTLVSNVGTIRLCH